MKNKDMKRKEIMLSVTFRAAVSALAATALLTAGCTSLDSFSITGYNNDTCIIDNQLYQVSSNGTKAFATDWYWDLDPENTDIYIPDTITVPGSGRQASVVTLGGYMGTGVPCPFEIIPDRESGIDYYSVPYRSVKDFGSPVTWEDLTFTVHIGKNVTDVKMVVGSGYYGLRDEDGVIRLYHPVCCYECDPENRTLYSKDGVLYLRADDSAVEEAQNAQHALPSGPVFSELAFTEKVSGRYRYPLGESEYAVAEFFTLSTYADIPGNDSIYANIGYYTEDSLYVYSAAVISPVEETEAEDILPADAQADDGSAGSMPAGIRQFSSFSHGGQYWNDEPDIYTITVTEDSITFTPVEIRGEGFLSRGDEVLVLERDDSLPSLFPSDITQYLNEEDAAGTAGTSLHYYRPYYLYSSPFSTGSAIADILNDDVFTVVIPDQDVPEIYRGTCAYTKDMEMVFALTRLGYGAMPYVGTVYGNALQKTLSVLKNPSEDPETQGSVPDAFPLIPEGETTVVAKPLN